MLRTRTSWVHQGEEFGPFDLTRATVGNTSRTGRTRIATHTGIAAKAPRVSSRTRSVDDGISLRLSGGPEAGVRARRALSRLRADIDPPLMETLRLLVTELVATCVGADADGIAACVEDAAVAAQDGSPRDDIAVLVLRVAA